MLYSFLQLRHCYAACMKLLCNYTRCGIWWGWEEYNLGQQYKMKIGISSTSVETRNILHKSFPINFLCIRYQNSFWFWDSNKLISWQHFSKGRQLRIIDIDKCKSYNIYWIYDNIEDDHVSDNDDTSYFTKTYKKITDTDKE